VLWHTGSIRKYVSEKIICIEVSYERTESQTRILLIRSRPNPILETHFQALLDETWCNSVPHSFGLNLCALYLLQARSKARFLITLNGRSGFVYVKREAAYCRTKVPSSSFTLSLDKELDRENSCISNQGRDRPYARK
jgi:hypothetical protein